MGFPVQKILTSFHVLYFSSINVSSLCPWATSVVEFDSNLKHCAVDHTDTKYRIVINFNYL